MPLRSNRLLERAFRAGLFSRSTWLPTSLGSSLAAWYKADAGCYTDAACLFASASSQYLSKTSPAFAPTTKMTVRFSAKPTSMAATALFVDRHNLLVDHQFAILHDTFGNIGVYVADSATDLSNYVFTNASVLTNGVQAEVVIVYDGTAAAADRVAIYVDGVAKAVTVTGTIPTSLRVSSAALGIGGRASTGANTFDGAIARLGFSSLALSGAALTAAHTSTFWADMTAARQADWFSFYNLCEASGTRVDSTGLNNLTPTNGPTVADGPGEGLCVDNSPVKRWESRYGSAHLVQATIANQPIWRASVLNGRGVVDFDGVSDYLAASGLLMGSTYTCGVLTERSGSASRYLIGAKAVGAVSLISRYLADFEFYGALPRIVIAATDAAASGFHSVVFGGDSGGMATRFDGAAAGTDAKAAPTGDADFTLGAPSGGGSDFFDGQVSEVVLSTAYTAPILASVDSYLNARR